MATLLQLLRSRAVQERRAERAYSDAVHDIAGRLHQILDDWVALREVESDHARLANSAAVKRWELMRLARQAEQLSPPRARLSTQRGVHSAVLGAARASQLLANGYRFHKSEAVCDGQALLLDSVRDMDQLIDQLRQPR